MIALQDGLPVLVTPGNEIHLIRRPWLNACLTRAAERAGYTHWWLATHVTESALVYLRTFYNQPAITFEQINEILRSVLQAIGFGEIAIAYETLDPPFEVSLPELALKAGPGYELAFFQLLRLTIQPVLQQRTAHVQIHGLQPCVRHLSATRTWSRHCTQLSAEIVSYLRAQLQMAGSNCSATLTIR